MGPGAWGGTIAGTLMVIAHLLVQQVTVAAAYGVLAPNRRVGLRTEATRRTAESWRVGHRAALPLVAGGTMLGIALAVAGVASSGDGSETSGLLLPLASAAVLGLTVLLAARRADGAATLAVRRERHDG